MCHHVKFPTSHCFTRAHMALRLLKTIRAQLLLLSLITTLPAVGIILYSAFEDRRTNIHEALEETRQLSDAIASGQHHLIASSEQLASALAQLPQIKNHDAAGMEPILGNLLRIHPQYMNIS